MYLILAVSLGVAILLLLFYRSAVRLGEVGAELRSERKRSIFLEKFNASISHPVLSGRKLIDGMRKWSNK